MFNEGVNPDYLGVFDCDYNGIGRLFDLTPPLELLFSGKWEEFLEFINSEDKRNVNFIENHDMATDFKRYELRHKNGQTELSLFLMYVGYRLFGIFGFLLGPLGYLIGREVFELAKKKRETLHNSP